MPTPFHTVRCDHTGALRMPDWLREQYVEHYEGRIDDAELKEAQERAVSDVIRHQEQIGLPVVTDGEFLRFAGFQQSFGGAVSGFDAEPYVPRRRSASRDTSTGVAEPPAPHRIETGVSGPGTAIYNRLPVKHRLKFEHNLLADEYALASRLASHPVKLTLTGPDRISQRFEYETSRQVYPDMEAFLADVVAIEREMIAEVVAAGCRYIQIDEPGYTAYVDPPLLERMHARGEDPRANMTRSIKADNALIEGFPDVTFAVHICRGNSGGRGGPGWHREGTYDAIAEQLYSELHFDRFLLEYDSDAAGTFDSLRFMPSDKVAVLGLVSNHGEVESPEYLKERLGEASRVLPLDQLALCPRCGMGSAPDEERQWSKLQVLQEVAQEVW
ncbi:MAG: cobalamin-independent methionine synthase II family protein [Chloroflexi bacterium]|nr:cobalamin-independent methionine synthase II family protein [Chloroflexota bacterium]